MLLPHGSGKTAVLVERMIQKIIKDKIDIDSILIVTFTNAAASEMKERILEAIYKKIEENPEAFAKTNNIIKQGKYKYNSLFLFRSNKK